MSEICENKKQADATRAEMIVVFVALIAIFAFSCYISHQAVENTFPDPVFRDLVRPESTKPLFKTEYLYEPLLFQFMAWLSVGAELLPAHIQETWLLKTTPGFPRRSLYFMLAFFSVVSVLMHANCSNAVTKAARSIDQSISTELPNSSTH
jgi:hypothetical protein